MMESLVMGIDGTFLTGLAAFLTSLSATIWSIRRKP
jgi:hypothetical protein